MDFKGRWLLLSSLFLCPKVYKILTPEPMTKQNEDSGNFFSPHLPQSFGGEIADISQSIVLQVNK